MPERPRERCRAWIRLALVALLGLCSTGCESLIENLAEKSDPGHAGARAYTLDPRDAYGNPVSTRDERPDR